MNWLPYQLVILAPTIPDAQREKRIEALRQQVEKAPTDPLRRLALAEMNDEIRARSPAMVAAMEKARGL